MNDDYFDEVLGSAVGSFIVVNQIKEHYLAASNLLAGRLDRSGFRFWMVGQILDACSKATENALDRLGRERGISRREKEKTPAFHLRICAEVGLHLGSRARTRWKGLVDHWNAHKHSGDGEEWKKFTNLRTEKFTLESFEFTTAFLAACYQLFKRSEEPAWLRHVELRDGEIILLSISPSMIRRLLEEWEITVSPKTAAHSES